MTIYDPIAIALDMAPIQIDFTDNSNLIEHDSPLKGRDNIWFGCKHTEETKKEMSDKRKEYHSANPNAIRGSNNPMYGKTHSDEVKQKLKNMKIGTTQTEETKKKIAQYKQTESAKLSRKQKLTGKPKSDAHRESIKKAALLRWEKYRAAKNSPDHKT